MFERRFKGFALRFAAALAIAALVFASVPLAAEELSSSRAKKVLKEADAAAAAGDPVKARELYQLVAAGTLKTPARRADALYGLVLVEAGRPSATRDATLLETSLAAFLKDFPKDPRRPVVAALGGLQKDLAGKDAEIAALGARIAAAEAELEKRDQAAAGASKESSKRVEELEARQRRLLAEIDNLKAEIAKKDEALKKLKKVVVGGG